MADRAFEWAGQRRLVRMNEMHGEEEAQLVLEEGFEWAHQEGERNEQTTSMQVDDAWKGKKAMSDLRMRMGSTS